MILPSKLLLALPILAAAALAVVAPSPAEAAPVTIKLGTLAPEGSVWHQMLQRVNERWKKISNGEVELKIYPGGVAGDESDMVRKMRIGQLHAAMITGIGLGSINRATIGLQIPMMIQSWDELDYVRDRVGPEIAKEMESSGFVILGWGDAGWVHFFSSKPAKTPEEYRKLKLFVPQGDAQAEKAWRKASFTPVPLSSTDVMSGLQTGMIDAFQAPTLAALSSQWFTSAKNMVKVNWVPLNGATVVAKKQWDKVDAKYRDQLLAAYSEEAVRLRTDVRAQADKAVEELVKRGLKVYEPDAAGIEAWRKTAELAYPDIRGAVVPEKYFDQIQRLVKEFRAKK